MCKYVYPQFLVVYVVFPVFRGRSVEVQPVFSVPSFYDRTGTDSSTTQPRSAHRRSSDLSVLVKPSYTRLSCYRGARFTLSLTRWTAKMDELVALSFAHVHLAVDTAARITSLDFNLANTLPCCYIGLPVLAFDRLAIPWCSSWPFKI